jgi:hypothetical protein
LSNLDWDEATGDLAWQGAGDPLSWRDRDESARRQVLVPTTVPSAAMDLATVDQYFSEMDAAMEQIAEDE